MWNIIVQSNALTGSAATPSFLFLLVLNLQLEVIIVLASLCFKIYRSQFFPARGDYVFEQANLIH